MSYTLEEILSQPSVWESVLRQAEHSASEWRAGLRGKTHLVFTGCGSTWYLAEIAVALFRRLLGYRASAVPGGELLLYRQDWLEDFSGSAGSSLLIAISRSGATTETVQAAAEWKEAGGQVAVVTNSPDSPLVSYADFTLLLPEGQEKSVVQTRSFTSMLVGLNAIAAILGEHRALWEAMKHLPQAGARLIEEYLPMAQSLGADPFPERFYFLGSGLRYGLAREASLKMKEMSLSHSEPFPFLEFRHGPISMVNGQTVLFGLLSDMNRSHELALLGETRALGARTITLADRDADVAFKSGIPEEGRGVLYLPVLQLVAAYRSISAGLDPDHPNNLTAVVTLNFETRR